MAQTSGMIEINANFEALLAKEDEIKRAVKRSGLRINRNAKRRAAVDTGDYRGSFETTIQDNGLTSATGNDKDYAPYMEFGTRGGVSVPSGYESAAAEWKRGNGFPPPGALLDWMNRHGIPESAEYAIRKKIFEEGTKPQPALIPSFEEEKSTFEAELKDIVGEL